MEIRPSNGEANPQCLDCMCLPDESWGIADEGVALEMTDPPMVRNTTKIQTDSGGEQIPVAAADDDTSTVHETVALEEQESSQSPTCNSLDSEARTVVKLVARMPRSPSKHLTNISKASGLSLRQPSRVFSLSWERSYSSSSDVAKQGSS